MAFFPLLTFHSYISVYISFRWRDKQIIRVKPSLQWIFTNKIWLTTCPLDSDILVVFLVVIDDDDDDIIVISFWGHWLTNIVLPIDYVWSSAILWADCSELASELGSSGEFLWPLTLEDLNSMDFCLQNQQQQQLPIKISISERKLISINKCIK